MQAYSVHYYREQPLYSKLTTSSAVWMREVLLNDNTTGIKLAKGHKLVNTFNWPYGPVS